MKNSSNSKKIVPGARFHGHSFFRGTTMSIALSDADVIPDVHLIRELSMTARLRHHHDKTDLRPSAHVVF